LACHILIFVASKCISREASVSTVPRKARPKVGSKTARVWEIADRLFAETGSVPSGREVVDLFVAAGGNEGTGFTQYSHWKKARVEDVPPERPDVSPAPPESVRLRIAPDGRLVVPAALRAHMKLDEDGVVTAWLDGGELRVVSPRVAIEMIQRMVRETDRGTGSPVDELIAERRAEARREDKDAA
jgi:bifunctional DNA-binding transcriptional regulator/antitoxin component of YhaV-PrlF toxin-antitoxin module